MIKITEKPIINDAVERNTFLRISRLYPSVKSSRDIPVINVKYTGIKGRTQGEKNDNNPARKAAEYEMVSANINPLIVYQTVNLSCVTVKNQFMGTAGRSLVLIPEK